MFERTPEYDSPFFSRKFQQALLHASKFGLKANVNGLKQTPGIEYFGRRFTTSELSLDHVIPRSRGGETTWENIVCSCLKCNVKKGGRTPAEAKMKLVTKPVKPKRNPTLAIKLGNPKYESWKSFVSHAYWSVDLK